MTYRTLRICASAVAVVVVTACGGRGPVDGGPVVHVDVPTPVPREVGFDTLNPVPTPTPTPEPTPAGPTPTPLAAPRGAAIRASSGSQEGSPSSFCWTGAHRCYEGTPTQTFALQVRSGETVLLAIDADLPPNSETIRPFQGSNRRDHPTHPVDPALETSLRLDLPPGEWNLDLCASWTGYGQPCWLFRLDVVEA